MTKRQENLLGGKSGHQIRLALEKLKMTFRSRLPHLRTILEDCYNTCLVAMKQHLGVRKDTFHKPQNTIYLRDTGDKSDNTTHMVFEGEPAIKLHSQNVEVGTNTNGNTKQNQVTLWRVCSPRSANH